jgi:hypothetical protein
VQDNRPEYAKQEASIEHRYHGTWAEPFNPSSLSVVPNHFKKHGGQNEDCKEWIIDEEIFGSKVKVSVV